ncbi:MAG TPA: DUF3079 domain-containing protein, partial [Polyangiaceae bacterium]|nr:DUF3079 domain-containing protein [Polyangiaceae bacterium]
PPHPERVCWGCDRLCAANDLGCGDDTVRTPHPCELFGDDWVQWAEENGAASPMYRLFANHQEE